MVKMASMEHVRSKLFHRNGPALRFVSFTDLPVHCQRKASNFEAKVDMIQLPKYFQK